MGGKRRGNGQHVLICLAGIGIALTVGCRGLTDSRRGPAVPAPGEVSAGAVADASVESIRSLMKEGDFAGALKQCEELATRMHPPDIRGEALYRMGLIHLHYDNPRKRYREALARFQELVATLPESPRTEEAFVWIGILQGIEQSRQIDREIDLKKKELEE